MSKKTFRIYLKGVTLDLKADDFTVEWEQNRIVSWEAPGAERWVFFMPNDIIAVERIK